MIVVLPCIVPARCFERVIWLFRTRCYYNNMPFGNHVFQMMVLLVCFDVATLKALLVEAAFVSSRFFLLLLLSMLIFICLL